MRDCGVVEEFVQPFRARHAGPADECERAGNDRGEWREHLRRVADERAERLRQPARFHRVSEAGRGHD